MMEKSLGSGSGSGLRSGFTTGTCAAGAAKAAAFMLLLENRLSQAQVVTPKGIVADLTLSDIRIEKNYVSCGVKKDAGDDPDVTDQTMVYASVERLSGESCDGAYGIIYGSEQKAYYRQGKLFLTGGKGIGIVTKLGLSCPVGKHAINPVPRQMIFKEVEEAVKRAGFSGSLLITISIPEGERLAASTFNPRLGIVGGLSVLGTSGIVEPMSEAALRESIRLELHMKAVAGARSIILTPGNYGERFLKEELGLSLSQGVQCSNFIGETVEMARDEGIGSILMVGHIGKLIKVAGGVANTHSKYGDRRMEILWDCVQNLCGAFYGEKLERLKRTILESNTTEEAVGLLKEAGLEAAAMAAVADRVREQIALWHGEAAAVEAVVFAVGHGITGMTAGAKAMIRAFGG